MSTNPVSANGFPFFLSGVMAEHHELRRNWACFLALGVALVAFGVLAIAYPVVATLTTVEVFGFLLLVGAGVEVVSGVWTRRWGGFFLHLFTGLLYLFVGWVIVERPGLGAAGYTLLLAVFFVAAGLVRVVYAATHRFSGWGWALLSGAVTLLLGVLVWRELPASALWVIGTFVGIELLFNGISWVMLGLAARSIAATEPTTGPMPGQPVGV
jgi:uncharacterized membrane protein HdeD (DUF308 family)